LRIDPKRGEIWLADLEPVRGSELQKTRPVVVLSSDAIRSLPVRVVAPITGWQEQFRVSPWKVRLEPNTKNGLSKTSAADGLQVRCLSVERFLSRQGSLPKTTVAEIAEALSYCLEE
jgi:mRNA interferase MazF